MNTKGGCVYRQKIEKGIGGIDLGLSGCGRGCGFWFNFGEKKRERYNEEGEVLREKNGREVKYVVLKCYEKSNNIEPSINFT